MPPKQYKNAQSARLSDYIEPKRFRTVMHEQYTQPHGLSETPVELELNEKFAASLSFKTPWDRWLYGFVRRGGLLEEINSEGEISSISLHDWDGRFLMIIDSKKGEQPYFVKSEEVKELLENCLRPPQQR